MAHDALAMVAYSNEPVLLLLGDTAGSVERARAAAIDAGCRVAAHGSVAAGPDLIEAQVRIDAVVVELDGCPASLEPVLDRLQAGAAAGRFRSVVFSTPAALDMVAAIAPHPDVLQLCDAGPQERVHAIAEATRPQELRVHDRRDTNPKLLHQLSEEVGRIANILASLSEEDVPSARMPSDRGSEASPEPPVDVAFIRSIIRARRLRDQFFPAEIFADPAWDMLLDLMAARIEGGRVAVSSLCIAAAVPPTTALRWIGTMTEHGFFVRSADPEDRRRVYIELSDDAARAMGAYLRALRRMGPAAAP